MFYGFDGGDDSRTFGQIVGQGEGGVDRLRSWRRIPGCHLDTGGMEDRGGNMPELERLRRGT